MLLFQWGSYFIYITGSQASQVMNYINQQESTFPIIHKELLPENVTSNNTVAIQDIRVETGLFFDLNKDYEEDDDCEEVKEDDCDGWWFWPFNINQTNKETDSKPETLLAYAVEESHGLFSNNGPQIKQKMPKLDHPNNNKTNSTLKDKKITKFLPTQNQTQFLFDSNLTLLGFNSNLSNYSSPFNYTLLSSTAYQISCDITILTMILGGTLIYYLTFSI